MSELTPYRITGFKTNGKDHTELFRSDGTLSVAITVLSDGNKNTVPLPINVLHRFADDLPFKDILRYTILAQPKGGDEYRLSVSIHLDQSEPTIQHLSVVSDINVGQPDHYRTIAEYIFQLFVEKTNILLSHLKPNELTYVSGRRENYGRYLAIIPYIDWYGRRLLTQVRSNRLAATDGFDIIDAVNYGFCVDKFHAIYNENVEMHNKLGLR